MKVLERSFTDISMDKKYKEDMMAKIVAHKDFGKRNPVDIGLDCGYTEDEVIAMLQALSQEKETQNEDDGNIIYVVMQKEGKFYIVSVNIDSWEAKAVKEVPELNYSSSTNYKSFSDRIASNKYKYPIYQIRKKIFAHGANKTLMWENLETGECGKIVVDSYIVNILILDDAIIVLTESEIIKDQLGKQRIGLKLKLKETSFLEDYRRKELIEGKDEIYVIDDKVIYAVQKDLNHMRKIEYKIPSDFDLLVVEYTETEGLIWYLCKGIYGFLSSYREWTYCKYTEKNLDGCNGAAPGLYGSNPKDNSVFVGINTANYRLVKKSILSRDWEHKICEFKSKNIYAVKDKDIFIGVSGKSYNKLIKIDLRNEREPVTLPVQMP